MPKNPETRVPEPAATRGGEGTSVRYDLRIYVYSDGHGNLTGKDSKGPFNLPVDAGDDAMIIWRRSGARVDKQLVELRPSASGECLDGTGSRANNSGAEANRRRNCELPLA